MNLTLGPLLALAFLGGGPESLRLAEWGPDPARGVLINRTVGAVPGQPLDPARPVLVVVHGLNPFHPALHFTIAERYAESLGARHGAAVQVFGWDWNAATMPGVRPAVQQQNMLAHGRAMAAALLRAGADPGRLHVVGQSAGCVVAAAAARAVAEATGRPIAHLTLIDPVATQHPLLFGRLVAGSAAVEVEHYWVPGPSGFGRPAPYANVRDVAVPGPRGALGLLNPLRTDHLSAVRWHIGQVRP